MRHNPQPTNKLNAIHCTTAAVLVLVLILGLILGLVLVLVLALCFVALCPAPLCCVVLHLALHRMLRQSEVEESLALAFLVAGKMTSYLGEVSSACGLPQASSPAITAAYVHMRGGTPKEIEDCVKYVLASTIGTVCDGAGKGCMLKAASAVAAACHSTMLFPAWGIDLTHTGIFGDDLQDSLVHFEHLVDEGLRHCDSQVLRAMHDQDAA